MKTIRRNLTTLVLIALFAPPRVLALSPQTSPAAPANSPSSQTKAQQAPVSGTDPLAPLLAQAQGALDRKDFAAAIPLLEKIPSANPENRLPRSDLGLPYPGWGKIPKATRK